ncbi:MAG: Extracellular solute-binding protein family 1 [Candidatus Amesbacteria bacterium GW2011_GWA1_47_20]|uniref:Extracellular solute-binding protein family 1 n=1 Tax=Candidatus Amesbacteria bacterium GW2011_GWA1_47_20 TaxID=1618354 RepID=A0A0G1SI81_9BACT|nr:MAG: Extracellular solute-binding protein family 1 [Candidatus Amesbacteria bacterium GW2011_GWA1_47_20]
MDLPPQPLAPNVAPQSAVGPPPPPPPPKKFPLTGIIIAVVVLIILAVGVFAAKSILSLNKKNQPVELTYWGLWESESRERLQTALAGGRGPDIFRLHSSWVPMFKNDLSPIPPTVYSASEFESTFYPTVKSDLRLSGNYVAVPLEIDGLAMFVNDDLLAASGQSVPATWEDLRSVAKAVSVCDSEDGTCSSGDRILVSGTALGTADNIDHWQDILATLMLQNNVNLNAPAGQSAEDVLSYFTVFSRTDHIWDSTLPPSTQAFAEGKLAIYFAPSWRIFDLQAINPKLKFSVHPVPQLPLDPARGEKPVTWASYWVEGVNKKSPNAPAAWEFLKFLSSADSLRKLYASSGRIFGEPYSRRDMTDTSEFVGPYLSQAQYARSWYIGSFTFDGPTGINTRLSAHFADAVNSVNQGRSPAEAVKTLSSGINQVLSQYGLASPIAP